MKLSQPSSELFEVTLAAAVGIPGTAIREEPSHSPLGCSRLTRCAPFRRSVKRYRSRSRHRLRITQHFRSSQAVTELETSDLPFRRSQNFPLFQNRDSSSDRAAGVPEMASSACLSKPESENCKSGRIASDAERRSAMRLNRACSTCKWPDSESGHAFGLHLSDRPTGSYFSIVIMV